MVDRFDVFVENLCTGIRTRDGFPPPTDQEFWRQFPDPLQTTFHLDEISCGHIGTRGVTGRRHEITTDDYIFLRNEEATSVHRVSWRMQYR